MSRRSIIVFGFNDVEKSKLKAIANKYRSETIIIENNMMNLKMEEIVHGLKLNKSMMEGKKENLINEKVILFNDFKEEDLNKIIGDIRVCKDLNCILAVVTPTSINWTFEYLVNHLIEEREWFKNNNQ
ncbi:DUF3783 domain-containing protein [Hathewaya limosa]|uniref:DUF3783 domain-containing protein n=1 Tax=Hathewaya limosa TaxID=1536 RepID=A0ABU0JNF6_HATLI|nr:DUF3783 domain-containing protein [Hathewaya limosa]MDQ0478610.1 hypothetical protein [Hathewaya limosa]